MPQPSRVPSLRALALLLLLPAGLSAQTPAKPPATSAAQPPTFASQVEQVVVDVVVLDRKGQPVEGLRKEDLLVSEDGVPQAITSFEAISARDTPATPVPAAAERISVNTDPAQQRGRTFAIVFDDTNLTPSKASRAKAAVASFLEKGARDGDRVSLVSTAGALWWTTRMPAGRGKLLDMVKRLDGRHVPDNARDRMSEAEALRIHVYHDRSVAESVLRRWAAYNVPGALDASRNRAPTLGNTVDDPMISNKATEVYFGTSARIRTALGVLARTLEGLVAARGRKSVILVSEGFISAPGIDEFRRVSEAARRANAAVYFVDVRGLEGMPQEMMADFGPAVPDQDVASVLTEQIEVASGAEAVASDSGGFTVRNTNGLAQGVQRIADESRVFYLLGYNSTNPARDGRFRRIQVRLADGGRGREVRARKGYYAPAGEPSPGDARRGRDPVVQAALDSPWAQDGIPLRMTHYVGEELGVGKTAVLVVTDVDTKALAFEQVEDRQVADFQFLLLVVHRETGELFRYDQAVNMKLQASTRARLALVGHPLVRQFELRPGDYQAKIVVRDTRSGRIGTVMHEFEVPAQGGLRASTPVCSDARMKGPNGELGPPEVTARRQFAAGSEVFCQVEVYGAKPDSDSLPRVSEGHVVRRSGDGAVLTSVAPAEIVPTSLGSVVRLFGFRLGQAEPGSYDLQIAIEDQLAGKKLELHEPFEVTSPAPAQAQ